KIFFEHRFQNGFPFMPGAAGAVALNIRHVSKLIYTHLIVNTNKKTNHVYYFINDAILKSV
ncbi:hypothetical protein, partial [Enterobacter hormaechei]